MAFFSPHQAKDIECTKAHGYKTMMDWQEVQILQTLYSKVAHYESGVKQTSDRIFFLLIAKDLKTQAGKNQFTLLNYREVDTIKLLV